MGKYKRKSLKWDLRENRIQQISNWVWESEKYLNKIYIHNKVEPGKKWFAAIRTLWRSIKHYIDEEEQEEVEKKMGEVRKKLYSDKPAEKVEYTDIEEIHDKVHRLRIQEAGLDIPKKTTYQFGDDKNNESDR